MSLDKRDLELIERLLYKNSDEISVAIGRNCERLAQCITSVESHIYSRLAEIEDKVEDIRQSDTDMLEALREDIREIGKLGIE